MNLQKRADNNVNATVPKPYVLSPSGDFDGNDGRWSSFYINIGDDAKGRGQNFKVLISTSSPLTLVPNQASWCNQDCAAKRGAQIFDGSQSLGFDPEKSQAWQDAGIFSLPLPHWWVDGEVKATYGQENVGLGESSEKSEILAKQYVGRYDSQKFFMGSFGLSQTYVSTGGGSSQPPFLVNFAESHVIPSISYGYSAGASYRNSNKGIPGNVVLGGYDRARIKMENSLNLTMPSEKNNTLVVGVTSILYKPNQNVEANTFSFTKDTKGFQATIDSTLPYLLLPDKVCDYFVERFGLQLDNSTGLYTVSEQSLRQNRQQNATVSFKITKDAQDNTNNFTTVNLPYDAFDLQANFPLTNGSSSARYFPIKKSPNGIFVLGRTFLQESYLVVDYERSTFTVAPAVYSDPMPEQKLVPIYNKTYSPPSSEPTRIPRQGDDGLAPGAIAGIVVGIVVAFLLAALGYFLWWRRRRAAQAAPPYTEKPQDMDTEVAGSEIKSHRISELDSEAPGSPKPSLGGYYDRETKDVSPFPPISEMESPPAELYSPPLVASTPRSEAGGSDYFIAGGRVKRRGQGSSGNNTPGGAVELPGDDGKYQVGGVHFDPIASPTPTAHSRGTSDTSLQTNIDEVVARNDPSPERKPNLANVQEENEDKEGAPLERRPSSHQRGLSDTTVQSDDTAVSAMTPAEIERWAMGNDNTPTRPLSE